MKETILTVGGMPLAARHPVKDEKLVTDATIIEWAPFELKEGVHPDELIASSDALQREFLSRQEGFIKRELLRKSETEYVDVVYWKDQKSAAQAVINAEKSQVCFAYFQLMKNVDHATPGAGVSHFEIIQGY